MKKPALISFLYLIVASSLSYSQQTYFSLGGEVALPVSSDFKEEAGFGYGGSISL